MTQISSRQRIQTAADAIFDEVAMFQTDMRRRLQDRIGVELSEDEDKLQKALGAAQNRTAILMVTK